MSIVGFKEINETENGEALFESTDDPVITNHAHFSDSSYRKLSTKCDLKAALFLLRQLAGTFLLK